jgi:hypothetical protein
MDPIRPEVPAEADWDKAPRVLEGAKTIPLTAEHCNLDYWFSAVAQGTLAGLVRGHKPESVAPDYMREPGPLRDALIDELGFRSLAEEKAARTIAILVTWAPDLPTFEFFSTQVMDEARHSRVFRDHLIELGVPEDQVLPTIQQYCGEDAEKILLPLEKLAFEAADRQFWIGGVILLTILIEGVLAPFAELSERKWRPLDPAAADIERGANIDEIRHLTVGADVVRRHLIEHPEERQDALDFIIAGRKLWSELPVAEVMYRRETWFQQGMEPLADLIGDYEVWDGRRLVDTTPEERMQAALDWSAETQDARLREMGLPEAVLEREEAPQG